MADPVPVEVGQAVEDVDEEQGRPRLVEVAVCRNSLNRPLPWPGQPPSEGDVVRVEGQDLPQRHVLQDQVDGVEAGGADGLVHPHQVRVRRHRTEEGDLVLDGVEGGPHRQTPSAGTGIPGQGPGPP